ncbi:hypothetical protein ACJX0J_005992 [Zea mays]
MKILGLNTMLTLHMKTMSTNNLIPICATIIQHLGIAVQSEIVTSHILAASTTDVTKILNCNHSDKEQELHTTHEQVLEHKDLKKCQHHIEREGATELYAGDMDIFNYYTINLI